MGRLLDRSSRLSQAFLVSRTGRFASVERGPQPIQRQVGQLFGHLLEPLAQGVDVRWHRRRLAAS